MLNILRKSLLTSFFCLCISTSLAAQGTIPLTEKALEGFWIHCESRCEGDFLCLAREKRWLEYYNGKGKTSHVNFTNSDGIGGPGYIEADVRDYSVIGSGISFGKLADEEEGWTWEIDEFYGDRTVDLGENEITEMCKVDNLDSVSQGLLKYMIALGEFESSPKKVKILSTISQSQTSVPMMFFSTQEDRDFLSFLLGRNVSSNHVFVLPVFLVFAGGQVPRFRSGFGRDSSGYVRNVGGEALIFVSPEVQEVERRRLFSAFD